MRTSLVAILAVLIVAGCASARPSYIPPPVSEAMTAFAERSWQSDAAALERGRVAMLAHCGQCHGMPSIHEEDQDQWTGTIQKMVKRAAKAGTPIPANDATAITHYILAANATVAK